MPKQPHDMVSRATAKAAGALRYKTGHPCKNGHMAERLTSNGTCMECARKKQGKINKSPAGKGASAKYRKLNLEARRKAFREWRLNNPEKMRVAKRNWKRKAFATDMVYKLTEYIRNRINRELRRLIENRAKKSISIRDLGCSVDELREYLESKFQPGMDWQNWSLAGWHIDHIKPLKAFDLAKREELLAAFHYTNLQPLWAADNLSKGTKI
jgi:hypothetical protein